jgi:tetratricopeptide (TPR) repeat protein
MLSWHDLRQLTAELKRRRVFRVAAGYVVVTFAILQGADVLFPALMLPAWTLTLLAVLVLLGLPITLVLAWAFDIGPDGIRRAEPAGDAKAGAKFPPPHRIRLAAVAALLVVSAAVLAWSFQLMRPATDVELAPDRIAILPFAVRGSPEISYLDEALVDLLSTKLNDADALRAVDPNALLQYLRASGGGAADIASGRQTAAHFGAGLFLLGSVSQTGGQLQLRATLYDHRGSRVAEAAASATEADLLTAVDELVRRLVFERLGEGATTQLARLAVLTTDSVDALKAYLRGERAFRRGAAQDAVAAFEDAISIDSTFALAYFRLSFARAWLPRGHPGFGRVLESIPAMRRFSDRLSVHTRLLGDAWVAYQPGGSGDTAERLAWQILEAHPDNAEAWYILGEARLHDNPFRGRDMLAAREPFERALSLDPYHPFTLTHLADLAIRARDLPRLDSLRTWIDERVPDRSSRYALLRRLAADPALNSEAIAAHVARDSDEEITDVAWRAVALIGDPATVLSLADVFSAAERGPNSRLLGSVYRAGAYAAQGRWLEARELLRTVSPLSPAAALASELLIHASLVLPTLPDDARLAALLAPDPRLRAHAASWRGDRAAFDAVLRALQASLGDRTTPPLAAGHDPTYLAYRTGLEIRAQDSWRQGDGARALQLLETPGIEGWPGAAERWILAEALIAAGRAEEALGWYESLPDYTTSAPAQLALHSAAQVRIARIHDAAGRADAAVRHYMRFVELYAAADAELQPLVEAANKRAAELRRSRS